MERFFHLKAHGTTVSTEIAAGVTTFFAMSYILFVNPRILSASGMPYQAVFLATVIASVAGTLIMGLFANVPYAQAPGMGLNAFFTYTVCFGLGFSWQQALSLVFLCGLVNIAVTVTKIRRSIIRSIPPGLQNAIGGGIGVFVAYIGFKNANLLQFSSDAQSLLTINGAAYAPKIAYTDITSVVTGGGIVPALADLARPDALLALTGLVLTILLMVRGVRGALLIGILATTLLGIPMGLVDLSAASLSASSLGDSFRELGATFGAALGPQGLWSLFSDPTRIPLVLITIFIFSLSDLFNTIGTFIGTGLQSGIFSPSSLPEKSEGFRTPMDRALFADAAATAIGAICGTSNVTTYVESAAGIGVGGRTGLTSVVTAVLLAVSAVLAPVAGLVPAAATAPALIVVGVLMMSAFREIDWRDFGEAVPCFFASVFMGLCYSISDGIAAGFLFYCLVKAARGKLGEVHPLLFVSSLLFLLNFILLAIL
ncbi:NCS2 family permease [Anaerotruncus rubiinfantis]|uniref:NCS2 family permease n=1 Tax=Anaerotruncus rubiinfantis TaxID=1720200 RepID=UPI000832CACB|nr:NCS2 family permease [Anaerotruncus rubiinfantis]